MTEPATREGAITGALYQFLATSSSFIAGSLFYIYLAKFYTPTDVGNVALLLATVGIFGSIFSLGLSQASQHFISYYLGKGQYSKIRAFVFRTITYGTVSSLVAMLSLIILSSYISGVFFHTLSFTGTIQLLSVYLFASIMFGILSGILLGMQRFRRAAIVSIFTSTLSYGMAGMLLFEYHTDEMIVFGWMIGYTLGTMLLAISAIRLSIKHPKELQRLSYREVMLYSSPILFSGIIGTSAAYIDRFVVAFFINVATLGIYNFVLLVSTALSLFLSPLYNVLLPKLSELFSHQDKESIIRGMKLSTNLINLIYVPAALGAAALSGRIIILLSQTQYLSATLPMAIFLIISAMFITGGVLAQTVSSIRKTPIFILSASATLASNIILSIFLIPAFGTTGAALSNSSVTVLSFFILLWYTKINGYSGLDFIVTLKVWFAAGTMAVVVYTASTGMPGNVTYLAILIALGIIIYLTLARVARIFSTDDKEWLRQLFGGKHSILYSLIERLF